MKYLMRIISISFVLFIFISCEKSSEYRLYLACIEEDTVSLENLLKNGISPLSILKKNKEKIEIANKYIEKRDLKFSTDYDRNQAINNFSLSPLAIVSNLGNINMAEQMLLFGANINEKSGSNGRTPLIASTIADNTKFSLFLLDNNADINIKDNTGATVLHYAANRDNIQIVEKLITLGIDTNQLDNDGRSPLYYAVAKEKSPNSELMEILLKAGANPNITFYTTQGTVNVLYIAVVNNKIEITKLLLKYNSNYDVVDSRGNSIYDIAESNNLTELQNILRPYSYGLGDKPIQELSSFLKKPVPENFKRLDVGDYYDQYYQEGDIRNNLLLQKGLITHNGIIEAVSYLWQSTDYEKIVQLRGDIIDKLEKEGVGRPAWSGSDQTIWFFSGFQIQLSTIGYSSDKYPMTLSIH